MQGGAYNTTSLQELINRNRHKGSAYCMKIMGLATYAFHKWRDQVFLKKNKSCGHPYQCPCELKLLKDRKIDRPFLEIPIRRPMIIDKKIVRHSARDSEVLIKVGLHISTIICADHTSTPAIPRNMTNYTDSEMRINNAFCRAYSGRMLRHNAVVKPARHSVTWINVSSPMMGLIFDEVHQKMHCGLGPQSYINGINLAGFVQLDSQHMSRIKLKPVNLAQRQEWF